MKIMFSAGELSGDMHGARLAEAIRKLSPEAEMIGFGGAGMANAGVKLVKNFRDYNIMGFWEVLKNLPRLYALLQDLTQTLDEERPDMLVLIDYPDFNWRLAKRAKALGIPVFSYIPPSAWAWRKGRAKKCAKIADEFVAIFPFETQVYQDAGANISYLGNPLVDVVTPEIPEQDAKRYFSIYPHDRVIVLLPGSRQQEIDLHLPIMLETAKLLWAARPGMSFFLPVAEGLDEMAIQRTVDKAMIPLALVTQKRYALMNVAHAAIATSGTVVMEAAMLGLPSVVLYRMSKFTYQIGKLFVNVENFSLPNILLGKRVLPELLQDEVSAENIAQALVPLCLEGETRNEVLKELKRATEMLGAPGSAERVAKKILLAANKYGKGA